MSIRSERQFKAAVATANRGLPGVPSADDEERRLAALRRYEMLDTPKEQAFDGIAALAGDLLGAPVALVSLLDRDRQWFKARIGITAAETPRDTAFCSHAIRRPGEVLVVPDARQDIRFAGNPLVTGRPGFRSYAGAPLVTRDGLAIGTVCVLSPEPRPRGLSPTEQWRLRHLASMAMDALELRLQARRAAQDAARAEARRAGEERLRLALEVADACAWEFDPISRLSIWDPAAGDLLGLPQTAPFEDALALFVHPDDLGRMRTAIGAALDPTGTGQYSIKHRAVADQGRLGTRPVRWLQTLGQAWFEGRAGGRQAVRMVCVTMDVTERQVAEERQTLLVAELNHRVKNTLAVVLAISELTRRSVDSGAGAGPLPPAAERRRFHAEFQTRLQALARAHNLLTREAWCGADLYDVVGTAFAPYHAGSAAPGRIAIEGRPLRLKSEPAVALAMVLHELATNAAQHGALSVPGGCVAVSWRADTPPSELHLSWTEAGGPVVAAPRHGGFGSRMMEAIIRRQLGGRLSSSWAATGLTCEIVVPAARIIAATAAEAG